MKQVKYPVEGKKEYNTCGYIHGQTQRESVWKFEFLLWGIPSRSPLANNFDLPGSRFISGVSQDPPMCAYASLSQDEFY